ncbi:Glycine betaine transport ATP-binding protein OpuAA [Anaerohalosphaera lusitana]|uniref:Glycine betaine transport ATP-binding protein OpuAA n=1 Tax=Anaerohalosphaera lusitana TaxID=1936003 RepID=A0A1U9NJE1_9BACT|nr:glycine betaine/L-proline ABC transporter ATP-binding protein [Anaerohalosphaera lusitana]AQT67858.1 Glycine betaine transport ATP-binding protein OpuAA [Anaerohalosphaera lusitana]
MSLLRIEKLAKIFGSHPKSALPYVEEGLNREDVREKTGQTIGIADVSFEVEKGEILVVMGLSGSGKSTLVRCVNRLIEPTSGRVYIGDDEITSMNRKQLLDIRRRKLGMVFQHFALLPHRTVLENSEYGLEIMGVEKSQRTNKAMEALEMVGLKGWENQLPRQLSGGMQQRVGLARALAVDPEIILMDEALSALDPLIRTDMQNELIDLQRKLGKTILFITHDLSEAVNMGDRIVLMKDGKVVQIGSAEEILTNPASRYVERFVEDLEKSKVLRAETIMRPIHEVAHTGDGPRTVLHKMREVGVSTLFVTDVHGVLQGIVRAEKASECAKAGDKDPAHMHDSDVKSVGLDANLQDVLGMMVENREPVAVVDDDKKLKGVIVIGHLLGALSEEGNQS